MVVGIWKRVRRGRIEFDRCGWGKGHLCWSQERQMLWLLTKLLQDNYGEVGLETLLIPIQSLSPDSHTCPVSEETARPGNSLWNAGETVAKAKLHSLVLSSNHFKIGVWGGMDSSIGAYRNQPWLFQPLEMDICLGYNEPRVAGFLPSHEVRVRWGGGCGGESLLRARKALATPCESNSSEGK